LVAAGILLGWVFYCDLKQRGYRFKETLLPRIAQLVDPGLQYNADGMIPPSIYESCKLYRNCDRYSGSDLFWGTYHGVSVNFSFLHTEFYTESSSRNGGRTKQWHSIFRGIFFVADFNKDFHSLTLVKPDNLEGVLGRGISSFVQKMDSSQPGKLIRMEDPVFEKEFVITTEDEQEARY